VGKTIMRAAAGTLKKISLELGGKSPNIFFADADFESAVEGALFGVFFNQGEVCSAGSRILVERPIYKKFLDAMVEKSRAITVGLPMDRSTKMARSSAESISSACANTRRSASAKPKWRRWRKAPARRSNAATFSSRRSSTTSTTAIGSRGRRSSTGRVRHPLRHRRGCAPHRNDTYFGLAAAVWTRDIFAQCAPSSGCAPASSG